MRRLGLADIVAVGVDLVSAPAVGGLGIVPCEPGSRGSHRNTPSRSGVDTEVHPYVGHNSEKEDAFSWSLADNLAVMEDYRGGNDRTVEVGIARNPAWSPDGRLVAFWASTDLIGRTGMTRARGSYGLYLLEPDTRHVRQILENVENTTLLAWSPDSQWLAFTGDIRSAKRSLWVVATAGKVLGFVDRGSTFDSYPAFNGWDWLNDREMIATRCLDPACAETEVLKYDVGEIVGATQ